MEARHVVAVALLVALAAAGPFVYDVSPDDGGQVEPVAFDRTESVGVPDSAVKRAQRSALEIPKAEVFYSEYRYPVGYYGVESLVASLQSDNRRSLGEPLAVYVSDFSGTNATLTAERNLRIGEDRSVGWVSAADAYFVVDSDAAIPTREDAVVPFSERRDAAAFAGRYGGEVRRWTDVRTRKTGSL
ncbi:nitrous oxide reductase accessory protein NosL, partial [Natronoarchaeum mannanilyticum]